MTNTRKTIERDIPGGRMTEDGVDVVEVP